MLQQSAYSFDFSLDQMLTGLANGGTVYVVPKSKRGDSVEVAKLISVENISYTKATPSEYASWIRYGSSYLAGALQWRHAFAGGESLTHSLIHDFQNLGKSDLRLFNSYGPGEVTISCAKVEILYQDLSQDSEEPIPAGLPLPNYTIYIVDRDLQPVPAGVSGEILIGGIGYAVGYLNNGKLMSEKFVEDKQASQEHQSLGWTKAYRSGDIGRFSADGLLFFERRIDGDTQIKLRGIRIELEDIESSIVQAAGGVISHAVASVRGDPQFLVAHVEFAQTFPSNERDRFLTELSDRLALPQYMRPARMIPLDAIPLNSHSKTD